jgi:hypothetical protein
MNGVYCGPLSTLHSSVVDSEVVVVEIITPLTCNIILSHILHIHEKLR